jgi:hypothetical protein
MSVRRSLIALTISGAEVPATESRTAFISVLIDRSICWSEYRVIAM